jgi:hypothetical protein
MKKPPAPPADAWEEESVDGDECCRLACID